MSRKSLVPFVLPADPTSPLEAATKQYVDASEIWVGPNAPANPAIDVWYDTDDSQQMGVVRQTIQTIAATTYTILLSDENSMINFTSATAITLTVPLNSTTAFPVGVRIDFCQTNTGQITVAPAGGVTIERTPSLILRARGSSASLIKLATDTWLLVGDLQ